VLFAMLTKRFNWVRARPSPDGGFTDVGCWWMKSNSPRRCITISKSIFGFSHAANESGANRREKLVSYHLRLANRFLDSDQYAL